MKFRPSRKQPNINDMIYPKGDKRPSHVWMSSIVMNVPQDDVPVPPSPTPSITPTSTLTPTPSITPTSTVTPTVTPTSTVTPTVTPTSSLTPTPTPSPLVSSVNFITAVSAMTTSSSYTFNSTEIGGTGLIVLTIQSTSQGPAASLSSVSVNGSSATFAVQNGPTGGHTGILGRNYFMLNEMYYIQVSSGTTANITINYTSDQNSCIVGVYRILNNSSNTPNQVASGSASANLTSLPSNSLVVACGTALQIPFNITNTTRNYLGIQFLSGGANNHFVGALTKTSGNLTLSQTPTFADNNTISAAWV